MALTTEERNELKEEVRQDVLNQIKAESQGMDELETVDTLDGMTSLPAMRGTEVVSAPLTLLSKPATDAAARANAAADLALDNAKQAETAAASAVEQAAAAQEAAAKATEATNKAETAAASYEDTALSALNGATARFGGFVEIDEEYINNGDIDFLDSSDMFSPDRVMFCRRYHRFLVQDSAKVYLCSWKGSEMYNTDDSMGSSLRQNKVYLLGRDIYVWDEQQESLVRVSDPLRHVMMTEAEYEALETKDENTLYLITEE